MKLSVGLVGSTFSLSPGDEHDFPLEEAERLIAAGYAVPVAEVKVERAVKPRISEKRG